jgi:UDP-N-acetylmuramoyl-L-alanyl-D-glutamate--2,6-diaminopimelate ligase
MKLKRDASNVFETKMWQRFDFGNNLNMHKSLAAVAPTSLSTLIDFIEPLQVVHFNDSVIRDVVCRPEESSSAALYGVCDEYLRYGVWTEGASLLAQIEEQPAAFITQRPIAETKATQIIVSDPLRATALVARHFYGNPDEHLSTIGITGTKGKTTTAHLVAQWLALLGKRCASMGTLGLKLSDGKLIDIGYTTPIATDLYRALGLVRHSNDQAVAMELSSHGIALNRHHGLSIDARIFTNLGRDHLDFHGTLEEYRRVKERLFFEGSGVSVLNVDDPVGQALSTKLKESITYGLSKEAQLRADLVSLDSSGTELKITWRGRSARCRCPLIGTFNVSNYLAAAGACLALGFDFQATVELGHKLHGVSGRLESIALHGGRVGVVDFAHTSDSLEQALQTVRTLTRGRVILVFGCGGDRDKGKRATMGAVAARLADMIFVTSDNPRTEDPHVIAQAISSGVGSKAHVVELDRRKAIRLAVNYSSPGDVILIAGKGHETKQIFATKVEHFSDKEELLTFT